MNCPVTDGAGFIGSNLVDALIEQEDRVALIDDLSTGKCANHEQAIRDGAELHVTDVPDAAAVAEVFAAARPQTVFHLATCGSQSRMIPSAMRRAMGPERSTWCRRPARRREPGRPLLHRRCAIWRARGAPDA
jgi:UDP-glucose 4-epimerase